MCVSGACLARGYLNNPELGNQQFIPDPYSRQPGSRLYKTGDLARYQADGTIELLGRADRQVNIRGFRVELNDVESVLLQHDSIQKCAVILRQTDSSDARLAAYLVTAADLSNSLLRTFLRDRLPDYMVPVDYIFLDALPLTPAGKVDSRALPAPDNSRPDLEVAYVAPETPSETAVASIWMELLKLDNVGVHDDFFDLGGHSLLASTMLFRLREMTAIEVPLRVLFDAPSIAALANHIDASQYINCEAANDALSEDREEILL
jgi:acyl carrier protein